MPLSKVTGNVVVTNYTEQFSSGTGWRNLAVKMFSNNRKLIRIDSKFGTDFIRSYRMSYTDTDTAGIDALTSIHECATSTGSNCYDPLTFDWGNNTDNTIGNTATTAMLNLGDIADDEYVVTSLDANGDGHDDFYVTGGIDKVYINNPLNNSFSAVATLPLSTDFSIADINADGYPDFTDRGNIYLWNGSGYEPPVSFADYGYEVKQFTDVNGDGLIDAIGIRNDGFNVYVGIFTNRYDQTHDNPAGMGAAMAAAFSVPQDIVVTFDDDNLFDGYESSFVSGNFYNDDLLYPPEIREIVAIYDANNDGVSEILVEFEKDNWCPDQGEDCEDHHVNPLYTSVYAELHYQQDHMDNLSYQPEYIGGSPACEACEVKMTPPTVTDINGDGKLEKCFIDQPHQPP